MSTFTCPNGHPSTASDYCDTCGVPIPAGATAPARAAPVRRDPATAAGAAGDGR